MAIILTVRHMTALWGTVPLEHRTVEILRANQAVYVAKNPASHEPTEIDTPMLAYVGHGCWRIRCRCGERTHTDPGWGIACCFGCGAIWTQIFFPDNWREIETLLAKRAVQHTRNWQFPEQLEDLIAEQKEHGEPT